MMRTPAAGSFDLPLPLARRSISGALLWIPGRRCPGTPRRPRYDALTRQLRCAVFCHGAMVDAKQQCAADA